MKAPREGSKYQEAASAEADFSPGELLKLRTLLRRLRYLSRQAEATGGVASESGGGLWAVQEAAALEFVLSEIEYLEEVA